MRDLQLFLVGFVTVAIVSCGGDSLGGPSVEDSTYQGACAQLNGPYVAHCTSVQGPQPACGTCGVLPDQVVDYDQAKPGADGSVLQGMSTWTITSGMTSANGCVQTITQTDTSGDSGTLIRHMSADAKFATVAFTINFTVGVTCTVNESETAQQ